MATDVEALRAKRIKQMQVVIMREVDGATFKEIGAVFGVSAERARQFYDSASAFVHNHPNYYLFSALVELLRK